MAEPFADVSETQFRKAWIVAILVILLVALLTVGGMNAQLANRGSADVGCLPRCTEAAEARPAGHLVLVKGGS